MRTIGLLLLLLTSYGSYSQKGLAFKVAADHGINVKQLDADYKSAIHAESDKAVFKSAAEQEKLIAAYQDYLIGLGEYLAENNFRWENNTRAFNRIYMNESGRIDYFLYDFKSPISETEQKEFERLLNLYIKDHPFGVSANEKFAQCSPVTFPKTATE